MLYLRRHRQGALPLQSLVRWRCRVQHVRLLRQDAMQQLQRWRHRSPHLGTHSLEARLTWPGKAVYNPLQCYLSSTSSSPGLQALCSQAATLYPSFISYHTVLRQGNAPCPIFPSS